MYICSLVSHTEWKQENVLQKQMNEKKSGNGVSILQYISNLSFSLVHV